VSRRVGIVGAAVTPFKGKWYEKTYYELAQMAAAGALKDAGIPVDDVGAVFYGIYNDIFARTCIPEHPLQGILGMQNKFGIRISTGGATGAYTISAAHAYLAAERFKVALVLGVEKATDCYDFMSMSATPEVIKTIAWSATIEIPHPVASSENVTMESGRFSLKLKSANTELIDPRRPRRQTKRAVGEWSLPVNKYWIILS